ncbi:hypothetical protein [Urbifossiella limnaea]|uniref:DUF4231 domain-containing protein n=1 Tax=Urbifossiella limnaea TaxID=2528023 RepID=A0A517XWI1_9BACT|nr:hypothetical protein [Urbifossiella limnaea]QDU21871.1 hypothetical protein ETAA1_38440 [Urbifossiella limnaea]
MATVEPALDHKYNDDLLAHHEDQAAIKVLFPEVFHVLDHPELRAEFATYNGLSNGAKRFVHRLGLVAVGLAALALMSSAMTPILKAVEGVPGLSESAAKTLRVMQEWSIYLEVAGLVGAAIALGGLWIGEKKKRWLEGRLMTEKLRAWHFQTLIHRGKEIEASCDRSNPNAVKEYQEKRAKWFTAFLQQHRGKLDSQLHELIDSPETQYASLHEHASSYPPDSKALPVVLEAYKALRLRHQADYAAHKLQKDTNQPFWAPHRWPTSVLKERLGSLSSFCIIGALLASAYVVLAHFGQWPLADSPAMPAVSLCFLVLNVTARGIMDGLAVREESQRYVDYSGEVRYLLTRYEATGNRAERLQIMQDMERAAVEELKGFLRAHYEAKFIV